MLLFSGCVSLQLRSQSVMSSATNEQSLASSPSAPAATPDASASAMLSQTQQLVSTSFQSAVSWISSATAALGHFVEEAVAAEDAQAARHEREEAEAAAQSGAAALSEANPIDPAAAPLDYTVTPTLLEFVDALSEHGDTFLRFPRAHQSFRLSALQESHARSVLAASPALARMRYRLAPSQIKEQEFWRIYFILFANVARKIKATESAATATPAAGCNCGLAAAANANGEGTCASHAASCPHSVDSAQPHRRGSSTATSPAASPARPSGSDASPAAASASASASATAASSTPVAAIPLDLREADRLCGLDHMHGRRGGSMGLAAEDVDDEDSQLDPQTDALIADILRRQRMGSNSLPSPAQLHTLQHTPSKHRGAHPAPSLSAEFAAASQDDALNTSELGVTEAELDEALRQQQGDAPASPAGVLGHERADSVALSNTAELP